MKYDLGTLHETVTNEGAVDTVKKAYQAINQPIGKVGHAIGKVAGAIGGAAAGWVPFAGNLHKQVYKGIAQGYEAGDNWRDEKLGFKKKEDSKKDK